MRCVADNQIIPDEDLKVLNYDVYGLCRECYNVTFWDKVPISLYKIEDAREDLDE